MYWDNDGNGFNRMHNAGYGVVMMVLGILFIVLMTWAVIRLIDRPRQSSAPAAFQPHNSSPLEIIDIRLAKGEISKDDYLVARELLEKK